MKIAIYGQFYKKYSLEPIETLLKVLHNKVVDVYIESDFYTSIKNEDTINATLTNFKSFSELDTSYDLLISIGGDGTILRAITHVRDLSIPIVGINTGRLGFLATIQKENIESTINEIVDGNFRISERNLLTISTIPENKDLFDFNIDRENQRN